MTGTALTPGSYLLGPAEGSLRVHTRKSGAAARAGHDLELQVGAWQATIELAAEAADTRLSLSADARTLRVIGASGGMTALDDEDRAGIAQTIDEEVLKGATITFRSQRVHATGDGRLAVEGELELAGATRPIAFELALDPDGRLAARAVVTQSSWGLKPYSALFGTLKVVDDVEVTIDARLPDPAVSP